MVERSRLRVALALPSAAFAACFFLQGCQQQMGVQPYYEPLESSPLFEDGRASRPLLPGTVSRGNLRDDDALYTGKVNNQLVSEFPMSITREVIERGQNRFNIYCAPCHSKLGDGNGMIVQRGVSRPPSFHEDRLLTAPVGHIYDVITNGYGRMYSYDHIAVRDRWAIVSYVRTLQASHQGTLADVPEEQRQTLQATAVTSGTVAGAVPAPSAVSAAPTSVTVEGGA